MGSEKDPRRDELDRARAFVTAATWVYAKTVEWAPHWYAVRDDCARAGIADEFLAFRALILEAGYDRFDGRWPWTTWRTLDLGGAFYYWLDDKPHLINRARHQVEAQLRLEGVA